MQPVASDHACEMVHERKRVALQQRLHLGAARYGGAENADAHSGGLARDLHHYLFGDGTVAKEGLQPDDPLVTESGYFNRTAVFHWRKQREHGVPWKEDVPDRLIGYSYELLWLEIYRLEFRRDFRQLVAR
jgi:hypothetical protein